MLRGSRQDMAAMASPQMATSPSGLASHGDARTTLMEDRSAVKSLFTSNENFDSTYS